MLTSYKKSRSPKTLTLDWITGFFRLVVLLSLAYIAAWLIGYFTHGELETQVDTILNRIPEPVAEIPYPVLDPEHSESAKQIGYYPTIEVEKAYLDKMYELNRPRFLKMLNVNQDFWGYMEIENVMRQPFVQGEDNDYYLRRNIKKENDNYGVVFMDYRNNPYLTDRNTLFYGHHMRSGQMFAALTIAYKGKTQQYLDNIQKNHILTIDSLTGKTTWLIFSAYTCEKDYGYTIIGDDKKSFGTLLEEIKDRSLYSSNLDVNSDDRIITLSTCDYDFVDARFVVHARRLRPGEEIPKIKYTFNDEQEAPTPQNQQNVSDIKFSGTETANYIYNNSKTYFYEKIENSIVFYAGNTSVVQGPYPLIEDLNFDNKKFSGLSSLLAKNNRTVYLATSGLGNGITVFTLEKSDGEVLNKKVVTPKDVDARNPKLILDNDKVSLLYSVFKDKQTEVYKVDIDGKNNELLFTADSNNAVPLGLVRKDKKQIVLFHSPKDRKVFVAYKDETEPETTTNAKNSKAKETTTAQEPIPPTWAFAETNKLSGEAVRIVLYTVADDSCRVLINKSGRLQFSNLKFSQFFENPPETTTITETTTTTTENTTTKKPTTTTTKPTTTTTTRETKPTTKSTTKPTTTKKADENNEED